MHTILYIDRVAKPDRCVVWFTVHADPGEDPVGAPIDVTFDRYGHLFPETNWGAARRMYEMLFGVSATKPSVQ